MQVRVRQFQERTDLGLIIDSFAKGVYHGGYHKFTEPKAEWFKTFHNHLLATLPENHIKVACSKDDPDFILGYSIFGGSNQDALQFVWVKKAYRRMGICKLLTEGYQSINESHLTKVGAQIFKE